MALLALDYLENAATFRKTVVNVTIKARRVFLKKKICDRRYNKQKKNTGSNEKKMQTIVAIYVKTKR